MSPVLAMLLGGLGGCLVVNGLMALFFVIGKRRREARRRRLAR